MAESPGPGEPWETPLLRFLQGLPRKSTDFQKNLEKPVEKHNAL
jgi:hypothetical protein